MTRHDAICRFSLSRARVAARADKYVRNLHANYYALSHIIAVYLYPPACPSSLLGALAVLTAPRIEAAGYRSRTIHGFNYE